ncbi:arsenic transporter [Kurthia senegalensis]|uniref:arsenic transporter n=1 Tax=Kurthia senegalensis TaxID=1033740 RepID=UPI000289209C|nr:arsenic transporter [Kurthia senegalensis]
MSTFLVAFGIFVCTMIFVIWQPRGFNIGWTALIGASATLAFGIVAWGDVFNILAITWNATLAFIGIIIVSLILDEIGVFEWAALHMAKLAKGSGIRLFIFICLLGAVVSAFFANDGAALILTPIVIAIVRHLRFSTAMILPFVVASGFIADTTSLPFTISNLVNIVSADYFSISFMEYATHMLLPNVVSMIATIVVLYVYFRKELPAQYELKQLKKPSDAIRDLALFKWSWWMIGILFLGYTLSEPLHIPVSFIVLAVAFLFLFITRNSKQVATVSILKHAPWHIVLFSIGMYVVVYGIGRAGLTDVLAEVISFFTSYGVVSATVGMGFLSAILSSIMNNLPAVMTGALAIAESEASGVVREALIYANVIGADLGPKITPIGSLATLVWLHVLKQQGIRITWGAYFKMGIRLTPPILLITLLALVTRLQF